MPRNRPQKNSPGDGTDGAGNTARRTQGFEARTTITDWLASEGAPWRPFDDKGVLVPARVPVAGTRPGRAELFDKACELQLYRHLKTVCLWPARDRDRTWRLGDFSTYVLEFTAASSASISVQLRSEPDERAGSGAVTFTVASVSWNPNASRRVEVARQEMLRDHGFEAPARHVSARSGGVFRKEVLVPGVRAVRALARETIAILCKVFEYDGSTPLDFHLHLGTRLSAGFTFDGICPGDLLKLMQRWGFAAAEIENRAGQTPLIKSVVQDQPFLVAFVGERQQSAGEYGMIGLRTFLRFEGGVPDGLPNAINSNFATVKASVDEDGDLVVQTPIILHGGVTAGNLEMCFSVWRETLLEIAQGLE